MQTHSSPKHNNVESSNRLVATIQPRSEDESLQPAAQSVALQPTRHDFSHVDLFAHDPGPRSIPNILQAKLTIGEPDDQYEQEADQVADRVMGMAAPTPPNVQRQVGEEEEPEEIQTSSLAKTITPLVRRQEMLEEKEPIQAKSETWAREESVQRAANGVPQAQPDLESQLNASQGGGNALPNEVRSFMEPRFGADFSQVRVHTGSEAVQMNQDLNAQAFTHKQDVYFGAGKAPANDELTAHELTHVVQQTEAIRPKTASASTTIQRDDLKNPTVIPAQQQQAASGTGVMSKQDFLNRCGQVNTIIDGADRGATAWLLSVALAYGDAWKNHTDTLKGQAESERLQQELLLGAALAFIPGGIGGEVGAALKRGQSSDFIIDGVKDLVKYGGRSPALAGLKGAGVVGQGGPGFNAFPSDPLQWQNQVALRIKSELLVATKTLEKWQESANTNDPNFAIDFDPVVAMNGAVVVQGKKATELKPVDQAQTAKDFEKGFWKAWLEQYGFTLVASAGRAGVFYGAQSNYGKKIRKRCESLGLDVEQYASVAKNRIEEEAKKRNREARGQ